jgi:hypothetical protein
MAEDQKKASTPNTVSFIEKRRESRYPLSTKGPRYHYIDMKVRAGNEYVPVVIDNLSRHGIQFESPLPFCAEAQAECLISISRSLSRDLAFSILIKHCERKGDGFICGATVETVADATWFDIFIEVHNYILQRKGPIY